MSTSFRHAAGTSCDHCPSASRPGSYACAWRASGASGFSLLELLVTITIVGVLASVAYPAYIDSVRKGRRAQARTAIAEVMQQEERFMTQRNCYMAFSTAANGVASAVEDTACGITAASTVVFKPFSGDSFPSSAYLLSARSCAAASTASATLTLRDCVRIEAQPVQVDAVAGTLWMTSTGATGCTGTAAGAGSSSAPVCWP